MKIHEQHKQHDGPLGNRYQCDKMENALTAAFRTVFGWCPFKDGTPRRKVRVVPKGTTQSSNRFHGQWSGRVYRGNKGLCAKYPEIRGMSDKRLIRERKHHSH